MLLYLPKWVSLDPSHRYGRATERRERINESWTVPSFRCRRKRSELMGKLSLVVEIRRRARYPEETSFSGETWLLLSWERIFHLRKTVFTVMYMGDARLVANFIFLPAGSLVEETFNVNYTFDLMPRIYRFFLWKINGIVLNLLHLFFIFTIGYFAKDLFIFYFHFYFRSYFASHQGIRVILNRML